jgi:hypothetical protein
VRAAKLARLGLQAARFSIEGDKGFLAALAQPGTHAAGEAPSRGDLARDPRRWLGERSAILRNIFKRYPFCLGCFEPLEGLRHILSAPPRSASDIAAVLRRDSRHRRRGWSASRIRTTNSRRNSVRRMRSPWCSRVMTSNAVPLPAALLADPEVRRWISVIRVQANREFGRRRARVTVTLKDGSSVSADQPFRNLDDAGVGLVSPVRAPGISATRGAILERRVDACSGLAGMTELMPLVQSQRSAADPPLPATALCRCRPGVPELVVRIRAPVVQPVELLAPHADDARIRRARSRDLIGEDLLDLAVRLRAVLGLEGLLALFEESVDLGIAIARPLVKLTGRMLVDT